MPSIQRFAIRCRDVEWRDLVFCEAKLLGVVDVVPVDGIDLVGVESTK